MASFFPGVAKSVMVGAVSRLKGQETWARDPLLREDGYNTLQDVLLEAGLLSSRQPYERIVRTDFAKVAIG